MPSSCVAVWRAFIFLFVLTTQAADIDSWLPSITNRYTSADLLVSDHALTHMIRERLGPGSTRLCTGIFDASLASCLLFSSGKFGILTTGPSAGASGMKASIDKGVSAFLGASAGASDRYAGCYAAGLGVLELRDEGNQVGVRAKIKQAVVKVVSEGGADSVILGCAGFAGMELVLTDGLKEAGLGKVRVVDGAKAGLAFLSAQLVQDRQRQA